MVLKIKAYIKLNQTKSDTVQVDNINHLSDQEQAKAIADSFSAISNEYEPVDKSRITIPHFWQSTVPQFKPHQIKKYLEGIKTNKATAPGDIPAKIIKEFAPNVCVPFAENWAKTW